MNRRTFAATVLAGFSEAMAQPSQRFIHRGYLGWITDLATAPEPNVPWPSMRLDDSLLRNYAETFRLMPSAGFNEATIWGFYVSRAWPVDIRSAVTPERGRLVQRLIESAHRHSIRVYSGLGVYSWGFEDIIRAHPKLSRTNPQAMCASVPEAWDWMQRVVDFAFQRFPIDGVSLQSADQGRCTCTECKRIPDSEYHALLNIRVCQYIRSKWPGKTVAINGWGMDFAAPETAAAVAKMSTVADYIIDVSDSSRAHNKARRRSLIQDLRCDFGTIGGPQVEPPQHWSRDRWFLPTARSQGEHLQELFQDGGRACEYFFHILANPADEISFHVAGRVLNRPETSWREHLRSVVAELYRPGTAEALDAFCDLLVAAEDAYMRHVPALRSGTISLEPLVSSEPGPPVYLLRRLSREQRGTYLADLTAIQKRFRTLAPDVRNRRKMQQILRCMENVRTDLQRT